MKTQFRAVIVDDERLARNDLKLMLSEHPEVQVVGEADSLQKAFEIINDLTPDVVFLDIQLSGETGFDLLDRLDRDKVKFKVIFVTAYSQYASRASEVKALDYLLKPIDPNRLAYAIKRLSEELHPN